jgi:hypothetical protein
MSVQNDHQVSHSQRDDAWAVHGSDFVLIAQGKPPPRIELARERLLICRLYLGLSLCKQQNGVRSAAKCVTRGPAPPIVSTAGFAEAKIIRAWAASVCTPGSKKRSC